MLCVYLPVYAIKKVCATHLHCTYSPTLYVCNPLLHPPPHPPYLTRSAAGSLGPASRFAPAGGRAYGCADGCADGRVVDQMRIVQARGCVVVVIGLVSVLQSSNVVVIEGKCGGLRVAVVTGVASAVLIQWGVLSEY